MEGTLRAGKTEVDLFKTKTLKYRNRIINIKPRILEL